MQAPARPGFNRDGRGGAVMSARIETVAEGLAGPARRPPAEPGIGPQMRQSPSRILPASCSQCNVRDMCLPAGLATDVMGPVDELVVGRRRIRRGDALVRVGDCFESLYAVRFGSLKSTLLLADGYDQVTGVHLPGEIVGFDGIAADRHACGVAALEYAEVCVIPYRRLEEVAAAVPVLQNNLRRIMSREIVREHSAMRLLASKRADERLAMFLLNFSQRLEARGYSRSEFLLRMTRAEIASFLGMSLETVSRSFSYLVHSGLLELDKKRLAILDFEGLRRVARVQSPDDEPDSWKDGCGDADRCGSVRVGAVPRPGWERHRLHDRR